MKLAMRLTLDGLIRALRMQAQQLADDVEFPDSLPDMEGETVAARGRQRQRLMTGVDDDAIRY
ncbi:hypothetical protein [Mesorhizobium sp. CN2-181]|uniref:hypothetical protein n=1 Tax=Mesorhizobium yinganensis TaxID=3157707 RepID=UPI0032B75D51